MASVNGPGVRGYYPQGQNEEGIALRKPIVLVLSIIAAMVAYKNVSEKNRKPIAAIILGSGLSYSFGLCAILRSVASILEKEEEGGLPPRQQPYAHISHHSQPPYHVPIALPPPHPFPAQQPYVHSQPPYHVPVVPPPHLPHLIPQGDLGGNRPQMKDPENPQSGGQGLDRPQQKKK